MLVGLGTDIVEISRISKIYEKFGEHFLRKIFSANEMKNIHNARAENLAGFFAAKEATVKALGTGFGNGVSAQQIEIHHAPTGAPFLQLTEKAAQLCSSLNVKQTHLSISHEHKYAIATVILEA